MVYEAEYGIYDDALRFYYTKLRLGSLPKDYYANQIWVTSSSVQFLINYLT
ncbi:hypothetical protein HanHA300_Chr08g0298401 [Helianthus annuus]|nr:hypothetical protein HanHA300_Chr08g0298401 [Helianthus annuus]KAJ0555212.1 hypothetical protein HanHA89_Chr08g0317031 [Helianthus annuus]